MTNRIVTISVAVAALMAVGACQRVVAEDDPGAAADPSGALTFTERPNLKEDVEAMPRLAGDTPQIAAINAELDRLDAAAIASAAECVEMAGDGPGGGWSRWIRRPMTGPAYVVLREHLDVYCGGSYPSTSQTPITYDLSTGARADWAALLPELGLVQDQPQPGMPADYVYTIRSPRLEALYERKMLAEAPNAEWREQCRDLWKPKPESEFGQGFYLWPDAEHGGVAIRADYVHAAQACGGTVFLTADELRTAGAPAAFIEAIAAAHAAGNWAPREDEASAE